MISYFLSKLFDGAIEKSKEPQIRNIETVMPVNNALVASKLNLTTGDFAPRAPYQFNISGEASNVQNDTNRIIYHENGVVSWGQPDINNPFTAGGEVRVAKLPVSKRTRAEVAYQGYDTVDLGRQ